MNLPIVIGLATYSNSKLAMLQFAYDCLGKFLDKSKYMWMESDTDSCYIAMESVNWDINDLVKPEMKDEFDKECHKWFADPAIPFTLRKPGLFKVEAKGTHMACLAAKTYLLFNDHDDKTKKSHKGLSHRLNKLTFDDFHAVLKSKQSSGGRNKGFRVRPDGKIWTYEQSKSGLPYLYIKRKVLEDGVSTKPLDI